MRPTEFPQPLDTLMVATCNVLNLANPGRLFYENQDPYSQTEFERKITWLGERFRALNADVLALVQAFDAAGKPIAAVCHGAQLLAAAGVLKGRECSAYPACGPEVQLAGGLYMDIGVDQAHVQGNLVTAPAWPAHPNWLAAFLGLLGTQISL